MKILVLGNSLVGCLLDAYDHSRHLVKHNLTFMVLPGATGPNLKIKNGRVVPLSLHAGNLPFCWPAHSWRGSLSDFDAVVVGAVGFMDDPKYPDSSLLGQFTIPALTLRDSYCADLVPLSKDVAQASLHGQWNSQPGVQAINKIREAFSGPIIVMPYPYVSEYLLSISSWHLCKYYKYPRHALKFFEEVRSDWLEVWSSREGVTLLPRCSANPNFPVTSSQLLSGDHFHLGAELSEATLFKIEGILEAELAKNRNRKFDV